MTWFNRRRAVATALALLAFPVLAPGAVQAQTIVDSWSSVTLPPPPKLESVKVDSAHTALLVLDMTAVNCVQDKRPSCARSLPHVKLLLDEARAHKMLVVYSSGAPGSTLPPEPAPAIARRPDEPMVRASVDKFLSPDLEQILAARNITTVIVVGNSSEGSVLYTASGAALRNMTAIVPLDGSSAQTPFAELYTAWHLKNAPAALSSHIVLSRSDLITID